MKIATKILKAVSGIIAISSSSAAPPPEGSFVNEDHKQRYSHCEKQLRAFDEKFSAQVEPLEAALRLALEERLLELAISVEPERIRKLQGITTGWFGESDMLKIDDKVPSEVSAEVGSYHAAVARRAEARDVAIAKEHHWLVRQFDQLSLGFEKKNDLEAMRILRKEAQALMPTAGLKPVKYGPLELALYGWYSEHPRFVRMQRIPGEQELIALACLTGNFAGGGEWVEIQVWDEGGLPGLHANSMQRNVKANADALRHPALKMNKASVRTESITFEKQRTKLIHHSRRFCYLGGIAGNIGDLTSGEVSINPDDGFYYL